MLIIYARSCQVCQDYFGESESLLKVWGHCNKTMDSKEYFVYINKFYELCQVTMFVMEGYCFSKYDKIMTIYEGADLNV